MNSGRISMLIFMAIFQNLLTHLHTVSIDEQIKSSNPNAAWSQRHHHHHKTLNRYNRQQEKQLPSQSANKKQKTLGWPKTASHFIICFPKRNYYIHLHGSLFFLRFHETSQPTKSIILFFPIIYWRHLLLVIRDAPAKLEKHRKRVRCRHTTCG